MIETPAFDPGEPPFVEVTALPPGSEDIGAPSFWPQSTAVGAAPAPRPLAATAAVFEVPAMSLPFAPGRAMAPGAPGAHGEAIQGPRAPSPLAGGTVAVSEAATVPSAPAGASELTMAQYTSLRVELQLLPDRTASVLGRYGVRPEDQEALFAHWRARFEADPPLRMWFARDYARYLAWVRQNPAALEGSAERPGAAPSR